MDTTSLHHADSREAGIEAAESVAKTPGRCREPISDWAKRKPALVGNLADSRCSGSEAATVVKQWL